MGCLPQSALFLVTESHSLTRIPEFILSYGEESGDPGLPWVVSLLRSNASHDDQVTIKVPDHRDEITRWEEVWGDLQVVTGFVGREMRLLGK
ncbi:hypothetical protein Tco_0228699 [Tanacetum coccineum]